MSFVRYRLVFAIILLLTSTAGQLLAQPTANSSLKYKGSRQHQSRHWMNTAREHMLAGQWAETERLIDLAIAAQHDLVDAYLLRAQVRERQNDLVGANNDYTSVIHLRPDHYEAYFQRAMVLFDAQRYSEARADLQLLLSNPPAETNAVFYRGEEDDGTLLATGIVTIQSDMQLAWLNIIGLTYYHEGNYSKAQESFNLAVSKDSTYVESYVNLGLTAESQRDTVQAIAYYRDALNRESGNAIALRNLALLARRQNNGALLNQIANQYGENTYEGALQEGLSHLDQKDFAAAIISFTRAISWQPNSIEAYLQRGFAHDKAGLLSEAIEDYTTVIKRDPLAVKAYSNRGNAHFKLEQHALANADYTQALALDPKNERVLYNRGIAYHRRGELDLACQDWQHALELGNKDAERPLSSLCKL